MTTIRRFEFTDAKSSKFWEIHVRGSETVTTWGRLGTDGQTKEKGFATDAKAEADMAKKIAEKVKKGYLEVGSSSAPAPPAPPAAAPPPKPPAPKPAPAPAPAPTIAVVEPPTSEPPPVAAVSDTNLLDVQPTPEDDRADFVMPKAWRKYVKPMRGHEGTAAPLGELAGDKGRSMVTVPDKLLARRRRLSDAAEVIATHSVRVAGSDRGDQTDFGPVIDDLVERSDLTTALLVLEEMFDLATVPGGHGMAWRHGESMKDRLRQHLVAASESDWEEARREAHRRKGSDASTTARLAGLFAGDSALFAHAVQTPVGSAFWWQTRGDLYVAATSPADLDAVLAVSARPPGHDSFAGRPLPTLLDRLGSQLTPFVTSWLNDTIDADMAKTFGTLLAAIGSDEAIELLAANAANKHLASSLAATSQARPHAAVRVLGPRVGGRSATDAVATRVVEALIEDQPGAVRNEIDKLDETTAAKIRALAVVEAQAPTAPADALPKLVASPPWLNRMSTPRNTVELDMLSRAVVADLPVAKPLVSQKTRTNEEWHELARELTAGSGRGAYELILHAPPKLLLEILDGRLVADFCRNSYETTSSLRRLVDRAGVDAFPAILQQARATPSLAFDHLRQFEAPEAAPVIASCLGYKSLRRDARAWLHGHPETAAIGLIPTAIGPDGADRLSCSTGLRVIATKNEAVVLQVADEYGPEARAAIDQLLSDAVVEQLPKRMPQLPDFLRLASTKRPLLVGGEQSLPPDATEHLATMLQISSLADPYVGIELVAEDLDPTSVAAWAWELFEAWDFEGKPSKHSWILDAQGLIGDDDTVRNLTPLIRTWPGEGGHKRAVSGLDALAAIGTEFALMQIYSISRKVKFKGIKARAQDKIEEIAQELGLTGEQLADRLVPDFDLDEHGSMTLDYGPRSFTVGFDQELKPFVKDESGKIRKALPSPGVNDDPELAPAAKKQFSQLKKDVRAVAADNLLRLEMAMCTERRWNTDDFRQYFLEHPLIVHLARRLVWATFDDSGVVDTFRVAEDGSLATPDDDVFLLDPAATVGIPHSLHLDDATAAAWGETFADYELLQPFDQLARESFAMTTDELAAEKFTRFSDGRYHPIGRFLGLAKFGWERGQPQDGGVVVDMIKRIDPQTALHLNMDGGIWTGMVGESEDTAIRDVQIGDGVTWRTGDRRFNELSPIVSSELIRDLTLSFPDDA